MENKKVFFVTGATGLIGSYLTKILLSLGHKVYALGRPAAGRDARYRLVNALKFWDAHAPVDNLVVLEGNVAHDGLGIEHAELLSGVDEIFHCAAITDLNRQLKEMSAVNVDGTRNVLDVALSLAEGAKLQKVNHISTAYVYGNFQGVFAEEDLDVGQKFVTNYEKTKFEAEQACLEYRRKGLWVDIYRPPIVIGESTTGKTFQFKHIYQFINMCALELFDALPVDGACLSLVPVDSLCEAMYLLSNRAQEKNKTYHPFPDSPIAIEDIIALGSNVMGYKKPKVVSRRNFRKRRLTSAQKALLQTTVLSVNFKTRLDSGRTVAMLQEFGFSFPRLDGALLSRMVHYSANKKNGHSGDYQGTLQRQEIRG